MKHLYVCVWLLLCFGWVKAQGGRASITYTNPTQLTICFSTKTFSLSVNNISSTPLTNVKLKITMPDGMYYDPASVVGGAEFDISVPKSPIFALADIPVASSINIDFDAYADCGINTFLAVDSPTVNILMVTYDTDYDSVITAPYPIQSPILSILSVSNQSYSGIVGDVFTRTLVIKNTGDGRLRTFALEDVHGSGFSVLNMTPGGFSNIGDTSRCLIGAGALMTIGNMDKFFDPGEQITITETIRVDGCSGLSSDYAAYWGCGNSICQEANQTGNITIVPGVPNLAYTITNTVNTCYASGVSTQKIKIKNNGTEPARNILIDVFQCSSNLTWDPTIKMFMFLDPASVQLDYHGVVAPATIDSFKRGNLTSAIGTTNYADVSTCLGVSNTSSLMGRFFVSYATLAPGDSVTLIFNMNTCSPTTCNFSGSTTGWRYNISYKNQCLSNSYNSGILSGRSYSSFYENSQVATSPPDLNNGNSGTFTLVNDYLSTWARGGTSRVEVEFTLPPTLTFTNAPGNLVWVSPDGLTTVNPSSVTVSGSTVTAYFPYVSTVYSQNSETRVVLTAVCGATGVYNIPVKTYMVHNTACPSSRMLFRCSTWSVRIHCPAACASGGFSPNGFDVKRVNYGLPDNDNNGLADGSGSLDFTKIRTERAVFGDTIEARSYGKVYSGTGGTTFNRIFNRLTFPEGSNASARCDLRIVSSTMTIYDKSTGNTYVCNNIANTVTNLTTTRTFLFEANTTALIASGCVPPGFLFEDQDSVVISCKFRMAYNIAGNVHLSQITDTCYTANVANPTPAQRYYCDTYNGQMSFIGYYYTTWGPDAITTQGCNTVTLNQHYYLSIGVCCSNYAGGNMFPYEYRQFGYLDSIIVQIPAGYTYVSATLNQVRTAGSNVTNTSATVAISPINPSANPLRFYVGNLYGSTIPLSDDGWFGTYSIRITPSCAVEPEVNSPVVYTTKFNVPSIWSTSPTTPSQVSGPTTGDFIYYQAPIIKLQSSLPTINAETDTVFWDVLVSNISTIASSNTWFGLTNNSGKVNVYRVQDLGTLADVLPTGTIYKMGTLGSGITKTYRIYAKYTNCNKDFVVFNTGWNCSGYPLTIASYPCTPQKLTLTLIPIKPIISSSVIAPPNPSNLCDTLDYEFIVTNTTAGYGLHPVFSMKRPVGMLIVPGSSFLEYPIGSGLIPIPDGKIAGANTNWLLDTLNASIATYGLKGSTNAPWNSYKIKFKVVTNCSYISGTYLRLTNTVKAGCGTTYSYFYSSPIKTITGVPTPYTTTFITLLDTIRDCVSPVSIRLKMINLGPGSTNATDRLFITLPDGIDYQTLSTVGIYNAPPTINPVIHPIGSDVRLEWFLPAGIPVGDSLVLTFQVTGDINLPSGPQDIDFQSLISYSLACGVTSCNINSITGFVTKQQYVDRPIGVWTGRVDTDWFNPYNWGDCHVPTCATDVTIPNVVNQPIINTSGIAFSRNIQINTSASVQMNASAVMHICGDVNNQGLYNHGLGATTHFTGNSPQTFTNTGTTHFENIVMNQSATSYLYLNHSLNIANTLSLQNGKISTGSNQVYVNNGASSAVNAGNSNSYVEGYLRRNVSGIGLYYLPVGLSSVGYELAEIDIQNKGDLTQLYSYFRNWPSSPPVLGLSECSATFSFPALNHGYWVIDGALGAIAPTYHVYLNNMSYSNAVGNGWTVMKRPTGSMGAWTITDGTCSMFSTAPHTLRYNLHQFSEFAVAQSPTVLPIQMLSFQAMPMQNYAALQWTTTQEIDSKGFEVQRAINATDFNTIAFVSAQSNTINQYQHNDFDIQTDKTYFYRLKQIDWNGGYQYSEVKQVQWEAMDYISVYPNPNKGQMSLEIQSKVETQGSLHLINSVGQAVWKSELNIEAGSNLFELDLKGMTPGVYTLQIEKSGQIQSQRIVITK